MNQKRIVALLLCTILLVVSLFGCTAGVDSLGLDYSVQENWAYYGIDTGENDADLFLVCPTVFKGAENVFNMDVGDSELRTKFVRALNMERGIYEESCRMYAPFYRQVGLNVYELDEAEGVEYFNVAYNDVRAAFLYYMNNINDGHPIVLAGFSQGADMVLRLLKEFFGSAENANLLVAAYIIGWRVTNEDISEYPFIKLAQGATDTGIVVSFNTEAENITSSIIVPDTTLGINPLNWSTSSEMVTREYNIGACFVDGDGRITEEIMNLTGAYLDPERGTLKVTDITPADYPPVLSLFEEGVYHLYDYQFFYRNLQKNVSDRVHAFVEHAAPNV